MPQPALMRALGFAGLTPFVVAAVAVWLADGALLALAQRAFIGYSLAILCFLGGTLWGSVSLYPEAAQPSRLLFSNAVVLAGVFGVVFIPGQLHAVALWLAGVHLLQLGYERRHPPPWSGYLRLRALLTLSAVVMHLVFAAGMLFADRVASA